MTIYTHKMVDGIAVPLTPEEIAECEQRDQDFANNPPPLIPESATVGVQHGSV